MDSHPDQTSNTASDAAEPFPNRRAAPGNGPQPHQEEPDRSLFDTVTTKTKDALFIAASFLKLGFDYAADAVATGTKRIAHGVFGTDPYGPSPVLSMDALDEAERLMNAGEISRAWGELANENDEYADEASNFTRLNQHASNFAGREVWSKADSRTLLKTYIGIAREKSGEPPSWDEVKESYDNVESEPYPHRFPWLFHGFDMHPDRLGGTPAQDSATLERHPRAGPEQSPFGPSATDKAKRFPLPSRHLGRQDPGHQPEPSSESSLGRESALAPPSANRPYDESPSLRATGRQTERATSTFGPGADGQSTRVPLPNRHPGRHPPVDEIGPSIKRGLELD